MITGIVKWFNDSKGYGLLLRRTAARMYSCICGGAGLRRCERRLEDFRGLPPSIDIAMKKAKTACFFGMPTGQIGKLSPPGGSLFGIEHSNGGLITFSGGLPIINREGALIGAIGISGSSVENDHLVTKAGVEVIGLSDLPAHPGRT